MSDTSYNQVIVKINGIPDIEIHTDGKRIYAYSYTLHRSLSKQETLRIVKHLGLSIWISML